MSSSRRVSAWNANVSGAASRDAANPRAVQPDGLLAPAPGGSRPRIDRGRRSWAFGPHRPTRGMLDFDRRCRSKVPSSPTAASLARDPETAVCARADARWGVHSGRSARRDERASHMDALGASGTAREKCRGEGDVRNLEKGDDEASIDLARLADRDERGKFLSGATTVRVVARFSSRGVKPRRAKRDAHAARRVSVLQSCPKTRPLEIQGTSPRLHAPALLRRPRRIIGLKKTAPPAGHLPRRSAGRA